MNLLSAVLVGHGSEISGFKGRQKLAEAPSQGHVCEQVGDGTVPLAGPLGAAGSAAAELGQLLPVRHGGDPSAWGWHPGCRDFCNKSLSQLGFTYRTVPFSELCAQKNLDC